MKKGTGTATHSGSTFARIQDMAEPVPFSSALSNAEGGATVCVANHDAERRATLANPDEERRATPADQDQERGAAYVCEKRVTQAGKLSQLEGVVKCINKRWKLLEALRPKESRLAPRRNPATRRNQTQWDDAPRREQQAGGEGKLALQPMHCVRLRRSGWPGRGESQWPGASAAGKSGMGREIGIAARALRSPCGSGQPRSGERR